MLPTQEQETCLKQETLGIFTKHDLVDCQGLSKLSRFVLRLNDCKASRVSIFDMKKCSGGDQLRWSRRQWFVFNLYDELGECSSGRESVRWSLDLGGSCTGRPVPRRCDARKYEADNGQIKSE